MSTIVNRDQNVPISEFRTRVSYFVDNVEQSRGVVVVIRNSRPAAMLVESDQYEEFRQWRKEKFWEGADEAFEEMDKGGGKSFDTAEELIADLHNEED